MEYINLLELPLITKILGLGFLTIIIMAVIELSYRAEMMGEDEE